MRTLLPLLSIVAVIGAVGARAGDVTWNYAGQPFDQAIIPASSTLEGDSLNASITFNGPLAPNLNSFNLQPDIVSWALWDSYGIFSYTSGEGCVASPFGGGCVTLNLAEFSTDANGNIIDDYGSAFDEFDVTSTVGVDLGKVICAQGNCQPTSYYLPLMSDPPENGVVFDLLIASYDPTAVSLTTDSVSNPFGNVISSTQDGVWSEATATPEPGTLFIVAAGLLGLAVVAGKRRFWARALRSEKQEV